MLSIRKEQLFAPPTNSEYRKLAAWFLGPKGENAPEFLDLLRETIQQHVEWRNDHFVQDSPYVTPELKESTEYRDQIKRIREELKKISSQLRNSVPFFSSRYKGHMNWDVSMIGMLGYCATMLYNPNNVAMEGSPVTTKLEQIVGQQLCQMLGYRSSSWGHITACGSISNIESLWAARNVKYLVPTIKQILEAIGDKDFFVETANGERKNVLDLTEWESLNIPADSALQVQTQLVQMYGKAEVENWIAQKDIQHVGLFHLTPSCYIVPITAHYSWPKAGAVLGIGQKNMHTVSIDENGRLQIEHLKEILEQCLEKRVPILQVVVVAGTTAEGVVDPVTQVLVVRKEFRSRGLDFFIHVDAAWGGYFCTMLPTDISPAFVTGMVPYLPLSQYVQKQLRAISRCDSCTVDPHKSGYIQYPAGALCYRNGSLRHLLTFEAPIITDPSTPINMGVYGIEGSKPGAAVVATYLHHTVVGLNPSGHGRLLGEAHFTTKKLYALLATMASDTDPFEIALYIPPKDKSLLKKIAESTNEQILADPSAMTYLSEIGPDLLINAFAVNFSWPILGSTREKNTDLNLANKLMQAIGEELNMIDPSSSDDTTTPKGASRKTLFLIRNTLGKQHSAVRSRLQRELGINESTNDMTYLVNTNMDPWPTATGFLDTFKAELRQSILRSIGTVKEEAHQHGFVITDAEYAEVFGNHLPVFSVPVHNYHSVVKFQFITQEEKQRVLKAYAEKLAGQVHPQNKPLIIGNQEHAQLQHLLFKKTGFWKVDLFCGFPSDTNVPFGESEVQVSDVLLHEHFDPQSQYPAEEMYLVYGDTNRIYMSHCISKCPDFHQVIQLKTIVPAVSPWMLELGFKVNVVNIPGGRKEVNPFADGGKYDISFIAEGGKPARASIEVFASVWFDVEHLNHSEPHHASDSHHAEIRAAMVTPSTYAGVIFEMESLGSVLEANKTVIFQPYSFAIPLLTKLFQSGLTVGALDETGVLFQQIGNYFSQKYDSIQSIDHKERYLFVSERSALRNAAKDLGIRTLAYPQLTLDVVRGEDVEFYRIWLPENFAFERLNHAVILHQFSDSSNSSVLAVISKNKVSSLRKQGLDFKLLDVPNASNCELEVNLASETNAAYTLGTNGNLHNIVVASGSHSHHSSVHTHGEYIHLLPHIPSSVVPDVQFRAAFTVQEDFSVSLLSIFSKDKINAVIAPLLEHPNRHVLSTQLPEVTSMLCALLEPHCDSVILQKFRLGAAQVKDAKLPLGEEIALSNIIGSIHGSSDETIVISAHLDSTAVATFGEKYNPRKDNAPGIDDDASGIAAVLLAAEFFKNYFMDQKPFRSLRFVLFNAEEQGLIGSQQYARMIRSSNENIVAVFHMDMIGYNKQSNTFEVHAGTSFTQQTQLSSVERASIQVAELVTTAWKLLDEKGLVKLKTPQMFTSRSPSGDPAARRSDHFSFHQVGYPACAISEDFFPGHNSHGEPNPNYHSEEDQELNDNYALYIARVVCTAALMACRK